MSRRLPAVLADLGGRRLVETMFAGVAVQLAGALTGPILAHGLGVKGRGEYAAVMVPFMAAIGIAGAGTAPSIARLRRWWDEQHLLAAGVWFQLVLAVPTAAILAVYWVRAASLEGVPIYVRSTYVLMCIPLLASNVVSGVLLGNQVGRRWNALRLVSFAVNLAIVLALLLDGSLTVGNALLAQAGAFAATALTAAYFAAPWGIARSLAALGPVTRYGLAVAGGTVFQNLFLACDQLLLSHVGPGRPLGLYVVAYAYAGLLEIVVQGLSFVSYSRFATDRQQGPRATLATLLLSATACVVLGALAPLIVPLAFGSGFRSAVPVVWVLLLARVMIDVSASLSLRLVALGRARRLTAVHVVLLPVVSGLAYGAYTWFGLTGLAGAMVLGHGIRCEWLRRSLKGARLS